MRANFIKKIMIFGIISIFLVTNVVSSIGKPNDNADINDYVEIMDIPVANNIYIDDDAPSGGDGSQDHPYQTIQDGVDTANNSDTVFVYNGTYNENVVIDKSIKLKGLNEDKFGSDTGGPIIDGMGDQGEGKVVSIKADGVEVSYFTIINSGSNLLKNAGIYLTNSKDCEISYNIIRDNLANGLYLLNSGPNNEIHHNQIFDNDADGISLYDKSNNNIVRFNEIRTNGYDGVFIYASHHNEIGELQECSNIIMDNGHNGVKITGWPWTARNNNILGNKICGNTERGILLDRLCFFNNINNNHICENSIHGVYLLNFCILNYIAKNNFINNSKNAGFSNCYLNFWQSNYWDDWSGKGPYIIWGFLLPRIDFGPWHEPYDICS